MTDFIDKMTPPNDPQNDHIYRLSLCVLDFDPPPSPPRAPPLRGSKNGRFIEKCPFLSKMPLFIENGRFIENDPKNDRFIGAQCVIGTVRPHFHELGLEGSKCTILASNPWNRSPVIHFFGFFHFFHSGGRNPLSGFPVKSEKPHVNPVSNLSRPGERVMSEPKVEVREVWWRTRSMVGIESCLPASRFRTILSRPRSIRVRTRFKWVSTSTSKEAGCQK